ncbi:MAG: DHA2 family efflux MFS transporter permease subunit [Acidimicrobiia bacterium]
MTATEVRPGPAAYEGNPWLPMSVVMAATIMVVLDSTVVNVALHEIGVDLGTGSGIEWVVTSYLLAVCAAQPATGWLADRFGRKQIFVSSLAAFTIASVGCAAAPNLTFLVVFRVLQGLGGGALMPVGMAMALDLFPRTRQGRAMSIWGMSAMAAPALGPTVGGWLITSISWHWLFLINLPIGVASVLAGITLLPHIGHRERRPFDALGLLSGSIGLSVAVFGLAQGSTWGWRSSSTIVCLAVGAGLLVGFVRHELHRSDPLIELRMFAERSFRLSIGIIMLVMTAQYARLVFVPLQLESLRGFTAFRVGTLFFVPAVFSAVGMLIGGRLVDSIGPRRPIIIGCAGMFVAMLAFWLLTLTTPVWVIGTLMSLQGLSWGLTTSPSMIAGLGHLPGHLVAQGSAVRSLAGQVSGALAVAVLGAVVAARMGGNPTATQAQGAYNSAFLVGAGGVLVALFLAWRLPRLQQPEGDLLHHVPAE